PISDIPGPFTASFTRIWHILRILNGDQKLELIRLHDKHGHFVRIAPNEVSLSHPDAIKKVLASPYLHKAPWYKVIAFPDSRFQNPMPATEPAVKNELSRAASPRHTPSPTCSAPRKLSNPRSNSFSTGLTSSALDSARNILTSSQLIW
ncbi:hypothetical protein B0T21DRAFT_417848, partial [Apiosordaria backusii]